MAHDIKTLEKKIKAIEDRKKANTHSENLSPDLWLIGLKIELIEKKIDMLLDMLKKSS